MNKTIFLILIHLVFCSTSNVNNVLANSADGITLIYYEPSSFSSLTESIYLYNDESSISSIFFSITTIITSFNYSSISTYYTNETVDDNTTITIGNIFLAIFIIFLIIFACIACLLMLIRQITTENKVCKAMDDDIFSL